jgi:peptidoglycan/LPS O-acetylase OafA/YrhL
MRAVARRPRAVRLEDRLNQRENNFDVLRLFAATLVLASHCFPLTGRQEPLWPVMHWSGGEIGVVMFFGMSGFLIAKSWLDQPDPRAFAVKRALRLLPALVVAVTLTALVLGPLFTTLSVGSYLTEPGTWIYIARNSVLYTVAGHLPGVFTTNVYPGAVNGSLWTLPVEAAAYVGAAALGLLGLLARPRTMLALLAVAVLAISPLAPWSAGLDASTVGAKASAAFELEATFVLGATLYALRDRLPLSWGALAGHAVLWILIGTGPWTKPIGVLTIGYGVLVLAFRTPAGLRRLTAPGDVSYGIYVYAFPVQQAIATIGAHAVKPLTMFGLAMPVTYGLALLSWRLVERPALSLKRLVKRAPARVAPASVVPVDPAPARVP